MSIVNDQLDLLDFIMDETRGTQHAKNTHRAAACRCLRDAEPWALDIVVHLDNPTGRNERGRSKSGDWTYAITAAGYRFETVAETIVGLDYDKGDSFWESSPRHLITWTDLAELIREHPSRPAVIAWVQSLAEPSWKNRYRPHELWPHPETWHPDYINGDHEEPGWDDRLRAWTAVLQIFTDTIAELTP